jgi:hypothetical protein
MRRRLPPRQVKGKIIDLSHFGNLPFSVYTASSVVSFLVLYTGMCNKSIPRTSDSDRTAKLIESF